MKKPIPCIFLHVPVLVVLACSSAPKPQTALPAESEAPRATESKPAASQTRHDKAQKSLRGADFELPHGWSVERHQSFLLIRDPDKELKLWMVDIVGKKDTEAIAAAWKLADPNFARQQDNALSPPNTDGWDSVTQIAYQVAAEESRFVLALSRSKDGIAYVLLLDSPLPALQRRAAQLQQIVESQKPPGLKKESFAGKQAKALDESMLATLDSFIEDARQKVGVPGAAVAVIQGKKVVFERGYGARRAGGGDKVTPDTAFMIGSTTKSLTSLMMAILVERGLFAWDTPMIEVLPTFTLAEPEVANKIQMQHSVCACTGLPRQDMEFIFEFKGVSPENRLAELAKMTPTTGFGETFQYSNALVSAGGFAAAHARWPKKGLMDAYVATMKETVLEPLGMKSTTFSSKVAARGNHARPHGGDFKGDYHEVPLSYEDAVISVAPAGGAWSTVRDLAGYVQLELARGKLPGGRALLSESGLLERRKPRIEIGERSAYGLALLVSSEADLVTMGHNGNTLGFSALLVFWPEHDLGLVVLSNAQGANTFIGVIQRRLLELVFGVENLAGQSLAFYLETRDQSVARERAKITVPPEPSWAKPILGRYKNDALGTLTVRKEGKRYVVDAGEWKSEFGKYTDAGQSTLMLVGPPVAGMQFQLQGDGNLLLDVGQQKYVFSR